MAVVTAPSAFAFWLRFAALLPVTAGQGLWIKRTAPRMAAQLETGDQKIE